VYDARLHHGAIDKILTSGELVKKLTQKWAGYESAQVVNAPGGIRSPTMDGQTEIGRGQPIVLGYVGRLVQEQKRALDIVPFVQQLDELEVNYRLLIIGTGPADAELRHALAPHIQRGAIEWIGAVTREELYKQYYPGLHCVLHFAAWEGITIAPREAMVHGAVPIVSDFRGRAAEGIYRHGDTALVFPVGNTRFAARCVQRLSADSNVWKRLSHNARHSHTGLYEWEGTMEAWYTAFEDMMRAPAKIPETVPAQAILDGRLAHIGLSPWWAQRIRDLVGKKYEHSDAGGEWPAHSGGLTAEVRAELDTLAGQLDREPSQFAA